MLALHVQLTVRTSKALAYRDYEAACVRIMSAHGGRLLAAFRPEGPAGDTFTEVHILSFPTEAAFQNYLSDPERLSLAPLQEECILQASVTRGALMSY